MIRAILAVIGLTAAYLALNLAIIYSEEQDDHVAEVEK